MIFIYNIEANETIVIKISHNFLLYKNTKEFTKGSVLIDVTMKIAAMPLPK